jgi:hypothetical protein
MRVREAKEGEYEDLEVYLRESLFTYVHMHLQAQASLLEIFVALLERQLPGGVMRYYGAQLVGFVSNHALTFCDSSATSPKRLQVAPPTAANLFPRQPRRRRFPRRHAQAKCYFN